MRARIVASKRTILVLDDDADTRHLTRVRLERAFPGVVVVECENAEDAVAAAARHEVDSVITDHHLGAADGATIIPRLRKAGVCGPVIMCTGSSDPAVYRRAYEAGAARVFAGTDVDFIGYLKREFGC